MGRLFNIVLHLNHAFAFDRRAFNGITTLANGMPNVRLLRRVDEMPYRDFFARRDADGVIASRIDDRGEFRDLAASGKPFVVLADHHEKLVDNEYVVGLDEAAIGRVAAGHFLTGGYVHFAVVCRPSVRAFFASWDTAVQDTDVIAALRFIQKQVARGVTVGQVADHVLLSRRTLERRFMETLGRTVQAEIRRTKIRQAQRLLLDTSLSYEEVARQSGLVTRSQLNRTIKSVVGLTPVQYRQNSGGQNLS